MKKEIITLAQYRLPRSKEASKMTKSEVRAFKARWAKVNAAERKELRTASLEQKADQTAALMASVQSLNWTEALASEEAEVRERWNELRKAVRK